MKFLTKRVLFWCDLAQLQDDLNRLVDPDWINIRTSDDFALAILGEINEIIDSTNWKWWKKGGKDTDFYNVKIEVIDILHFFVSRLLLEESISLRTNYNTIGFRHPEPGFIENNSLCRSYFMNMVRPLIDHHTSVDVHHAERFLSAAGMSGAEVSAFYVAKWTLNNVRQNTGYKDGSYVKVRDGIEDNVLLKTVIEEFLDNDSMTLDDVRVRVEQTLIGAVPDVR